MFGIMRLYKGALKTESTTNMESRKTNLISMQTVRLLHSLQKDGITAAMDEENEMLESRKNRSDKNFQKSPEILN